MKQIIQKQTNTRPATVQAKESSQGTVMGGNGAIGRVGLTSPYALLLPQVGIRDRDMAEARMSQAQEAYINHFELQCHVARGSLTSVLIELVLMRKVATTWGIKGDDQTFLHNLEKCLAEIRQVLEAKPEDCVAQTAAFSSIITESKSMIFVRELFEHCSKISQEFRQCVKGRTGHNSYEEWQQNLGGWAGWAQIGRSVLANCRSLSNLLKACDSGLYTGQELERFTGVIASVKMFHAVTDYIAFSFTKEHYPDLEKVKEIYTNSMPEGQQLDVDLIRILDEETNAGRGAADSGGTCVIF